MTPMRANALTLGAAILVLVGEPVLAQGGAGGPQVQSTFGTAMVSGLAAQSGMRLEPGTSLRTGAGGLVVLRWQAGGDAVVAESSELEFPARTSATPARGPDVRIRTGVGSVSAGRGAMARLAHDPAGGSTIEVLQGEALLRSEPGGAVVRVRAGQGAGMRESGELMPLRPLLPAPTLWSGVRLLAQSGEAMDFSPPEKARRFRVAVHSASGAAQVVAQALVDAPRWQLPLLEDGDYFVKVRARDTDGVEGHESTARLRVRMRAEAPSLSAPEDRARIYGQALRLTWTGGGTHDRYWTQVSRDRGFRRIEREWREHPEPWVAIADLAPGDYFWRVARVASDGRLSLFSDPRAIALRATPQAPLAPVIGDASLRLRWPAETGGEFDVQLAADAAFARLIVERTVRSATVDLPRPPPGTYYARVRPLERDGSPGPFSAATAISVPPPRPARPCAVPGPGGVCLTYETRTSPTR
jgi:hypothetical protein